MPAEVVKASATAWYDSPLYYDMVYADYTKKETRFIEGIVRGGVDEGQGVVGVGVSLFGRSS